MGWSSPEAEAEWNKWLSAEIAKIHARNRKPSQTDRLYFRTQDGDERICLTCRGLGHISEQPEYGPRLISTCYRCDGHGVRA